MMYTSAKQFFGPMVLTYFRHKVITNQYAVMGTRWTNINVGKTCLKLNIWYVFFHFCKEELPFTIIAIYYLGWFLLKHDCCLFQNLQRYVLPLFDGPALMIDVGDSKGITKWCDCFHVLSRTIPNAIKTSRHDHHLLLQIINKCGQQRRHKYTVTTTIINIEKVLKTCIM